MFASVRFAFLSFGFLIINSFLPFEGFEGYLLVLSSLLFFGWLFPYFPPFLFFFFSFSFSQEILVGHVLVPPVCKLRGAAHDVANGFDHLLLLNLIPRRRVPHLVQLVVSIALEDVAVVVKHPADILGAKFGIVAGDIVSYFGGCAKLLALVRLQPRDVGDL